jgi:hypothetical protein
MASTHGAKLSRRFYRDQFMYSTHGAKLSRRFYHDQFMYSNPDFQTQKVSASTQLNVNVVLLGFAGKCMADKMESDLASSKPCRCSHWESILIHKIKNFIPKYSLSGQKCKNGLSVQLFGFLIY